MKPESEEYFELKTYQIKEEIRYPDGYNFKNTKGKEINFHLGYGACVINPNYSINTMQLANYTDEELNAEYFDFTNKEFNFLIKTYDFKTKLQDGFRSKTLRSDLSHNHKLYNIGFIALIEGEGEEYLVIYFQRWEFDFQPRGRGEDDLGESITYIHGIWENPELTDSIREKIRKA